MQPLIIDSFAGGGGASTGIEMALGRSPDIAINHSADALAMHAMNHPATVHLDSNIWDVSPKAVCAGRPVGLLWASPDCKHFSKAKGGKPLDRNIRDLAWVVVRWAEEVKPDVILLENVEEFRTWGPIYEDGSAIAELRGHTFEDWVKRLKRLGYAVQHRELRACDYGAPTIRKRLFVVARRDGRPIVWPKPTHGKPTDPAVIAGHKLPWRTAAEIIDWSLPCPSIFDTSAEIFAKFGIRANRPLADATMRRIARGVMRYVIEAKRPFLIPITHHGDSRTYSADEPLRTITTANRGEIAAISPLLVQLGYGERDGQAPRALDPHAPIGTQVAGGGKHGVVAAFLAQHNGGMVGHDARKPVSTVTMRGTQQQVVAAHLMNMKGSDRRARAADDPLATLTAGGGHASLVAAFLTKYYGEGLPNQAATDPMHCLTTKPRHGLVTVEIDGQSFAIVDIGMRMLTPRERFRAQGFPDEYIIDRREDGSPISATVQGSCCGNSVSPPVAAALAGANCEHLAAFREAAE